MTAPLNVAPSSSDQPLGATPTSGAVAEQGEGAATAPAPVVFCERHFSWLCGVGQGKCQTEAAPAPRVVSIDPSLTATGLCDGTRTWTVRSRGAADATLYQRDERIHLLAAEVISDCAHAALVVIESPALGSVSGHMHDRSWYYGALVRGLRHRGIDVAEVAPTAVKKYATGRGNATKGQVIEAARDRYPDVAIGGDDNRADALFLWAIGFDRLTGVHVVPESHRVALDKVRWPAMAADR